MAGSDVVEALRLALKPFNIQHLADDWNAKNLLTAVGTEMPAPPSSRALLLGGGSRPPQQQSARTQLSRLFAAAPPPPSACV